MHSPVEDRSRVLIVINTLKTAGIRVKNWKNYINGATNSLKKERQLKFAFGRDLSSVPQFDVKDVGGTVPKFLVDSCGFLSQHLHTEGLFRKTGSLTRIRALRAGLERGEPVFSHPYSATLQPCDVASLLKQFLRELPCPLIPLDLQGPLCHAQGLEEGQEGARDEATLLITALFPAINTRTLQYLCMFLRRTADRCTENRMEVGNLALVLAPNLLQSPAGGSKLTAGTERQLDIQAAVIKVLIAHADRIGVIPPCLLSMSPLSEGGETTPPSDGGKFQQRGVGVYRSLKRQRRRSVGEIFVDALSKLKTGFNPSTGSSNPAESQLTSRPTSHLPITVKRKCTEDPVPDVEGSAKKRRSVQDLREIQSVHLSNVVSEVVLKRKEEACVTPRTSEEKNNPNIDSTLLNRPEVEEDHCQRRRSLRFFNTASWNILNTTGHESVIPGSHTSSDDTGGVSICKVEHKNTSRISVNLNQGPGRGVTEIEMEDDPDLLNLSFIEDPTDPQDAPVPTDPQDAPVPTDPQDAPVPTDPQDAPVPTDPQDAPVPTDPQDAPVPTDPQDAPVPTDPQDAPVPTDPQDAPVPTDPRDAPVPTDPQDAPVPTDPQDAPDSPTSTGGVEREGDVTSLEVKDMEVLEQLNDSADCELGGLVKKTEVHHKAEEDDPDKETLAQEVPGRVGRKHRAPRRSISLPEVNLELLRDEDLQEEDMSDQDEEDMFLLISHKDQDPPQSRRTNTEDDRPTMTAKSVASITLNAKKAELKWEPKTEKPVESGFKKCRMSMADHLRRFNSLATLLRAPRTPPTTPAPLLRDALHETLLGRERRGALGLQRQGARRFGRSISHDGVPGPLGVLAREEDQPGGAHSPEPLVQSAPPQPTGELEAFLLELDPETHRPLGDPRVEKGVPQPGGSRTMATKPGLHHLLQEQLSLRGKVGGGDVTSPGQLDRQTQTQATSAGRHQTASLVGKDLQVQSRPSTAATLYLHTHKCCLHISMATQTDTENYKTANTENYNTANTENYNTANTENYKTANTENYNTANTENYNTANMEAVCLPVDVSAFDFINVDMEGCSLEAPPPALTLRPQSTRRRYRDSPRWLIHEVSMASGDPLQI